LKSRKRALRTFSPPRCPRWLARQKRTFLLRLDPWTPLLASSTQHSLFCRLHNISDRSLLHLSFFPYAPKARKEFGSTPSVQLFKMPPSNGAAWLRAPATPLSVGPAPYTPPGLRELVIRNGAVALFMYPKAFIWPSAMKKYTPLKATQPKTSKFDL